MKIALIGYGKMGQMIESLAIEKGHEIVLKIHIDNTGEFTKENISVADVAIEFTGPHSAFDNVKKCLEFEVPVVSGSTGWNEKLTEARKICQDLGGCFLHASNFSIGVNIFFEINKLLAKLMSAQPAYTVSMKEVHHTQKKDAPSGTAVTLAEQVIEHIPSIKGWVNQAAAAPGQLSIESLREDPAPGTHFVKYHSDVDDIEIIHTAHSREGFALGAILAAEYISNKKGIFSMKDVLNIASS